VCGRRIELTGLGEHRLEDFPTPERLWQLAHAAAPGGFPPLRTETARPTNPPADPGRSSARPARRLQDSTPANEG
jgi:hypothetical protein